MILTEKIKEYWSTDNRLKGGNLRVITPHDAMEFQAHLLLHLLNDNIIPVPRSEIFCKLQMGITFHWDEDKQQYLIEVKPSIITL